MSGAARRIAIVGGGVAGIAAAVRLAEAGERPILIETRKRLGGRATSFVDPRSGETIDNCQHVAMGCCTNLVDLYERLGVLEAIRWDETTYWANPPHDPDRMTPGWLPAPAHFSGSFLRLRFLPKDARREIAGAMWKLLRMGTAGRVAWRTRPFVEFLHESGQGTTAIDLFWRVLVVSACNVDVEECAAHHAIQVLQEGFLGHRWSSAVGIATVPLARLYDPALETIERAGGEVLLGTSARGIAYDGARVSGVVTEDGLVRAAAVIAAVPPDRLAKLCSVPLRLADARLQRLEEIAFSPILGVHMRFETAIMDTPHLVLPGRDTHWLFEKGVDEAGAQYVHAVISGADGWMDLDENAIVERVLEDVHWALPKSVGLRPIGVRAVKEKRATFRATVATEPARPPVEPGLGVANLFLAGDWCDTGWPATMEGATRSGYRAAAAITGKGGVIPDLPIAPGARLVGLR